jgi:hypothetical protein
MAVKVKVMLVLSLTFISLPIKFLYPAESGNDRLEELGALASI